MDMVMLRHFMDPRDMGNEFGDTCTARMFSSLAMAMASMFTSRFAASIVLWARRRMR